MKRMMIGAYDYYNFEYFGGFQHSRVSFLDKIFTQPYQIPPIMTIGTQSLLKWTKKFLYFLFFFQNAQLWQGLYFQTNGENLLQS